MPYTTASDGTAITPTFWNTNVRDQTVAIVTSSTRPGSPVEGQLIYETDTERLGIYNGSSWILIIDATTGTAL